MDVIGRGHIAILDGEIKWKGLKASRYYKREARG